MTGKEIDGEGKKEISSIILYFAKKNEHCGKLINVSQIKVKSSIHSPSKYGSRDSKKKFLK